MPISYSIEGRVLFVLCDGRYTHKEIRELTERAIADPRFEAPMYLLADARTSTSYDSAGQLNELSHFFGAIRHQFANHWSIVIESEMSYLLSQLVAAMLKIYGIDVHIYRDLETARAGIAAFELEQARKLARKKK